MGGAPLSIGDNRFDKTETENKRLIKRSSLSDSESRAISRDRNSFELLAAVESSPHPPENVEDEYLYTTNYNYML